MRRTAIHLPMDGQHERQIEALKQIVSAYGSGKLHLEPYHSTQDPSEPFPTWFRGMARSAGYSHAWKLEAAPSVSAEEIREIGNILFSL